MTNGVILNVLSNKRTKDAISFSEEDEEEIPIMIEKDVQKFKDRQTMYSISRYSSLLSIDIHRF
jgi:hypothetical protein